MSLLFLASSAKVVEEIIITIVTQKGTHVPVDRVLHTSEYKKDHSSSKETRVTEHVLRNSSAVQEHCQLMGNSLDSNKTNVLATGSHTFKRRLREEIKVRFGKPSFLNKDNGFEHLGHHFSHLETRMKII